MATVTDHLSAALLALDPSAIGGDDVLAFGTAGALIALFRLMFTGLSRKDSEVWRLVRTLRYSDQRNAARAEWERVRADHWYAVALGDPNPPALPPPWVEPPRPDDLGDDRGQPEPKGSRWKR